MRDTTSREADLDLFKQGGLACVVEADDDDGVGFLACEVGVEAGEEMVHGSEDSFDLHVKSSATQTMVLHLPTELLSKVRPSLHPPPSCPPALRSSPLPAPDLFLSPARLPAQTTTSLHHLLHRHQGAPAAAVQYRVLEAWRARMYLAPLGSGSLS